MSDKVIEQEFVAIRPKFVMESERSSEEIMQAFMDVLSAEGTRCTGLVMDPYITINPPTDDLHYWSPQLSIYVEEEDNKTVLSGRYGPRPGVWTMFVFFYSIIGMAVLIIGVIGFANMSLDESGSILWLLPILILAFLSLYLVAFFGQKKGHDQMHIMQSIVERALQS